MLSETRVITIIREIRVIATTEEQTCESSSVFCLPLPLEEKNSSQTEEIRRKDQSEPNLIEAELVR